MTNKFEFLLIGVVVLMVISVYFIGQTAESSKRPWLEPKNPNRLEWLALEKQSSEGENEFGGNGMTVNFYLGHDSYRTGEILCDIAYLPSTTGEMVQIIEGGIQKRFEMERKINPWARVKIIKQVARPKN